MPYNHDFSDIQNIREVELYLEGWVQPIYIEYGLGIHGTTPSYFWKIKGTKHTFVIPVLRINFLSSGDYNKHFSKVLNQFRDDYLKWSEEKFYIDWMEEYHQQFIKFISI